MNGEVFYSIERKEGESSCALHKLEEFMNSPLGVTYSELRLTPFSGDTSELQEGAAFISCQAAPYLYAGVDQKPILFSWQHSLNFWSREVVSFKKTPILKALGVSPGDTVVDATCGMGQDSSFLLHAGLKVLAYERFTPTAFLLSFSAWRESIDGLDLYCDDYSRSEVIHKAAPIYYDPMFDDGKKRKAKAKKSMTLFHELLDAPEDSHEVAKRLLQKTYRLVIKRPPKGQLLLPGPNAQWKSKAVRFDLYLNPSFKN